MEIYVPNNLKKIYTTEQQARQINNIILLYIDKNSIITDATSCIGGNSYYFSKIFKSVISVEKDYNTCKYLLYNTRNLKNIKVYNCSYNIIKYCLKQDIIFLDPPWGGNIYKTKKTIELYLDNINVIDIINNLYNFCKIICLKVPNNFKTPIYNNFWKIIEHCVYSRNKQIYKVLIFIKNI